MCSRAPKSAQIRQTNIETPGYFFELVRQRRCGIAKSAFRPTWTGLGISRGIFWAELWGLAQGPLLEYMMVEPGQDMLHRHTTLTKIFSHLVAKHTNRFGIVH